MDQKIQKRLIATADLPTPDGVKYSLKELEELEKENPYYYLIDDNLYEMKLEKENKKCLH